MPNIQLAPQAGGPFISLADTPAAYAGQVGKFLRVNAVPDAVEFVTSLELPNAAWVGAGAAAVRLVVDTTAAPDEIDLVDGYLNINDNRIMFETFAPAFDTAYLYLQTGPGAGQSYIVMQLCDIAGASSFRIHDSGVAEVFRVDSDGKVGIGTVPLDLLHVKGDAGWIRIEFPTNTSFAGLALYEGAAVRGGIQAIGSNFADATRRNEVEVWATGTNDLILQHDGGYVGVGTYTPFFKLDVYENRAASYAFFVNNAGGNVNRHVAIWRGGAVGAAVGTTYFLNAQDSAAATTGTIHTTNGVFQLADASDERRKVKIEDTKLCGLDIINALRVRDYNWKDNPDGPVMTSFVAQEAQEVYSDMIVEMPDGDLGTSRGILIPILAKAIQELSEQLEKNGCRSAVH